MSASQSYIQTKVRVGIRRYASLVDMDPFLYRCHGRILCLSLLAFDIRYVEAHTTLAARFETASNQIRNSTEDNTNYRAFRVNMSHLECSLSTSGRYHIGPKCAQPSTLRRGSNFGKFSFGNFLFRIGCFSLGETL